MRRMPRWLLLFYLTPKTFSTKISTPPIRDHQADIVCALEGPRIHQQGGLHVRTNKDNPNDLQGTLVQRKPKDTNFSIWLNGVWPNFTFNPVIDPRHHHLQALLYE